MNSSRLLLPNRKVENQTCYGLYTTRQRSSHSSNVYLVRQSNVVNAQENGEKSISQTSFTQLVFHLYFIFFDQIYS